MCFAEAQDFDGGAHRRTFQPFAYPRKGPGRQDAGSFHFNHYKLFLKNLACPLLRAGGPRQLVT